MSRVASRDPRVSVLLPVPVLVGSGTAAGFSTRSKPAHCKHASQLTSAVSELGNVHIAKREIGLLTTALDAVKTDTCTVSTDAKTAFGPQTTALKQALSDLDAAIKSAKGKSVLSAAKAIVPAVSQVEKCCLGLQDAVSANASDHPRPLAGRKSVALDCPRSCRRTQAAKTTSTSAPTYELRRLQ